nr:hypothetical protein [Thermomicrobium sp. CFH 73360]
MLFWIGVALTVTFLVPFHPLATDVSARLQSPSLTHWFGTDDLGRDIFRRTLYGARISLPAGFLTVLGALVIGCLVGAIAGYAGAGSMPSLCASPTWCLPSPRSSWQWRLLLRLVRV